MTHTISAHFDGKVIVPDDLAADLPDAPPDLAAQHDHYLYGSPKR